MDTTWSPRLTGASGPKYLRLLRGLRQAVDSGDLPPGRRLPPVRELAHILEVTPGTVARAYRIAVEEGLLEARVGRGTFVAGGDTGQSQEVPLYQETPDGTLDGRSVTVPDVGQGAELSAILAEAAHSDLTAYPGQESDQGYCAAMLDWLGADHIGRAGPSEAAAVFGAQNGTLVVLQRLLAGPHPVILTETLCYPGVRRAASLLRAGLRGVAMDGEGLIPEALDEACRLTGAQVLLTSAEVHSPTTIRTGAARKAALVEVARRHRLQIIEDDCHRIAAAQAPSYRALYPERGWYVTSMAKTVGSGLRLGMAVAPEGEGGSLRRTAAANFYGAPVPLVQAGERIVTSGLAERSRRGVEAATAHRVGLVRSVLGRWDIASRDDAPFVWLTLPPGWRASRFTQVCASHGIHIKPADEFALVDGQAPHAVRVTVNARVPDSHFTAALEKMDALLADPPQDMEG
ncbi:aminotransferase-like domain-containing protein [Histidinibacterium aquaticum]|uniref:aminotransferase-like domain-containing protein n=1 Tax=Histidinibacterium aquaticum TaxID=2613962 RepID=UPI001CC5C352|nr:PLP-dependent aminotransferase family protein [Histidinibacterium aquaticum]